MAAGVTIRSGQMPGFRAHITEALAAQVAAARARTAVQVDAALTARGATPDFVHDIERAGPFGAGNAQPVFVFPAHRVRMAEVAGQGGHVRFLLTADDGARVKGIAFRAAGTPLGQLLLGAEGPLHFAGTLGVDTWQGRETVQFRVLDVALPDAR
jgi:single-stranded-DNA-specific exonuclease